MNVNDDNDQMKTLRRELMKTYTDEVRPMTILVITDEDEDTTLCETVITILAYDEEGGRVQRERIPREHTQRSP